MAIKMMLVFLLFLKHGFCTDDRQAECNMKNNYCVEEEEGSFEQSYYSKFLEAEKKGLLLNALAGETQHLSEDELRDIYRGIESGDEIKKKQFFIPLGLSDKEKIGALAAASLGLVIFKSDQSIMDFVQDNKTEVTHKLETFGYYAGRNGIAHLVAGSYLMGAIFDNGKLKDVGILTVGALIVSQTITDYMKVEFGRYRPRDADGDPYQFGTEGHSFVSGHSSGAFTVAAVLADVYKGTAVPYLAYGIAGIVAYARVHEMGHYASDVFYGAIVGVLSANIAIRVMKGDDTYGGILVTPSYSPDPVTQEMNFYLNIKWEPKRPKPIVSCEDIENLGLSTRETVSNCMQKAWLLNN